MSCFDLAVVCHGEINKYGWLSKRPQWQVLYFLERRGKNQEDLTLSCNNTVKTHSKNCNLAALWANCRRNTPWHLWVLAIPSALTVCHLPGAETHAISHAESSSSWTFRSQHSNFTIILQSWLHCVCLILVPAKLAVLCTSVCVFFLLPIYL